MAVSDPTIHGLVNRTEASKADWAAHQVRAEAKTRGDLDKRTVDALAGYFDGVTRGTRAPSRVPRVCRQDPGAESETHQIAEIWCSRDVRHWYWVCTCGRDSRMTRGGYLSESIARNGHRAHQRAMVQARSSQQEKATLTGDSS